MHKVASAVLALLLGCASAAYDALLSSTAMSYDEAQAHCRALGRRLPLIETVVQMQALHAKCTALGRASDCTWLSLRCMSGTASACKDRHSWHWHNGDGRKTASLVDAPWSSNGGNYLGAMDVAALEGVGHALAGKCTHLRMDMLESESGLGEWMPVPCASHNFALCELPGGELSTGPHLTLPPGLNKIVSMASDDAFTFAALYTGQLIKMNQLDMSDFGVLNLNV